MRAKRYLFLTAVVWVVLLGFIQVTWAETAYVSDSFKITFRSGPGATHRIISMLSSGQALEVLERGDEWARVRLGANTDSPQEGWVMTRYLIDRRPWEMQAEAYRAETGRLKERIVVLQEKLKDTEKMQEELTAKLNETTRGLDQVQAEYAALKEGSAEYLALKNKHEETLAKLKTARDDYAALNEDYKKLSYSERNTWFAIGAGILVFGLVFGMILGRREKKRRARLY